MPYSKQINREFIQEYKQDNFRLNIDKIIESSHGINRETYYYVSMSYGARCIYDSVESNTSRLWHIFDTIQDSIRYGRKLIDLNL